MKLGDVPRKDQDESHPYESKRTLADLNNFLKTYSGSKLPKNSVLKRSSHDYCSEENHIQYKKRRKQSKPVKIEALDNISTDHDSGEENDVSDHDDNTMGAAESPFDHKIHNSSHQCPYCSENFLSDSSLQIHVKTDHIHEVQENINENQYVCESESQIPLNLSNIYRLSSNNKTNLLDNMYNQWNTDVHKACEEFLDETNELEKSSPPDYSEPFSDERILFPKYLPLADPLIFPTVSTTVDTVIPEQKPVQCQISLPVRVFNPEAFCQLCNKEFCNKYFLKTHKANKHGIFVENSQPSLNNTAQNIHTVTTNIVHSQQSIAYNSPQEMLTKLSSPINCNEESSTMQLMSNNFTKASCDICKKKFCNRYFVRRHKAKVHGIKDDPYTSTTSSCLRLPQYGHKLDCNIKVDSFSDTSIKINSSGQNDTKSCENKESDVELCSNEAEKSSDKLYSDKMLSKIPTDGKDNDFFNFKEEQNFETEMNRISQQCENLNSSICSGKVLVNSSPDTLKDAPFSIDKLKQLGVINADAFCEICCKEYCNKYFLRTHKMKRHGITFSDGELQGKDGKSDENVHGPCIYAQTSPLNLIIGDQGNNSSDSGERIQSDSDDIECDICGRKFQSLYLLHMHRTYLHAVRVDETETENVQESTDETEIKNSNNSSVSKEKTAVSKFAPSTLSENCDKYDTNDDLQKLKTMITQLNDLSVSKVTVCTICNKDMQTPGGLKSHMTVDHGIFFEENTGIVVETHSTFDSVFPSSNVSEKCSICKKEFISKAAVKQHIEEVHSYPSQQIPFSKIPMDQDIKIELDYSEKGLFHSGTSTNSEKRTTLAPTNSYCEICNKELCNKYFMKTHMQRMHGIEIENGAQIGGVICDICNKELCSKYFLRVHKQNTHGIIEEGPVSQQSRDNSVVSGVASSHTENDHALKPLELGDLSHRYFTHFTEVCPLCNRRFRSTKWLKAHLFNDHGDSGAEKWKDIETKNNVTCSQSKKTHGSKNLGQHNHNIPVSNNSPTLKIPSNWSIQEQNGTCLRSYGQTSSESVTELDSQKVITNLLGATNSSLKSYNCSYCSFSTTILAFLFVHEKSHTGLSSNVFPNTPKSFQCPVCSQSFDHIDVYQHHVVTHQFSGIMNPLFNPSHSYAYSQTLGCIESFEKIFHNSPERLTSEQKMDRPKKDDLTEGQENLSVISSGRCKFRCSKCFQRFRSRELCAAHVANKHGTVCESLSPLPVSNSTSFMVAPQKHFKCSQCNFSSIHSVILKKHIRKEHKYEILQHEFKDGETNTWMETKDVLQDVKKKLEDTVKVCKIPASYAVPQSQPPYVEGFLMQPFFLEEQEQKFFPSLVFLPVKKKMSEPLNVSFMLTPA